MKQYILSALIYLFISSGAFSQPSNQDVRSNETKIADLLMQLPASSSAELDRIMTEFQDLGAMAVKSIASNIVTPGEGNDVKYRYAISGIAKFASASGDPNYKLQCSKALSEAISDTNDEEVIDFLLQELQYVAGDESVSLASSLLNNERLCDPASRVLIRIDSEKSKEALFQALAEVKDESQQMIMVQAIGNTGYQSAQDLLTVLAANSQGDYKKVVLNAMAQLGDPVSLDILAAEAEKVGFSYDPVEATNAYFTLLGQLIENGHNKEVEKACKEILKNNNVPFHIRSSALRIWTSMADDGAYKFLSKALKSAKKEYRMSAIYLLEDIYSTEIAKDLQKKASKAKSPVLKSELIDLFGRMQDKSALPMVLQSFDSNNNQLLRAAITAATSIGKTSAITPLMVKMQTADDKIITTIKTQLLTIKGKEVANSAASFISKMDGAARAALIEIIAHRQASHHKPLVFQEVANDNPKVSLAAAKALSNLTGKGDEQKIAILISKTTDQKKIKALQDALFMSINDYQNESTQVVVIDRLMRSSGGGDYNYFPVFARVGGEDALKIVQKEFESSSGQKQELALQALCNWSDDTALNYLLKIAEKSNNQDYAEMALNSYITGINQSKNSADQKVLMFRKAMNLAGNMEQKTKVLQAVSENSTLQALAFVGSYFDDKKLQQAAVQAVSSIVLANAALYGPFVEKIIKETIQLNQHPEADYQIAALQKHLESLPEDNGFVSLFNGENLEGWQGLVEDPIKRSIMTAEELLAKQKEANQKMLKDWSVKNGILAYEGNGFNNLCTVEEYEDFELILDWKIGPEGDGGIYLRGTPQVQIWDTSRVEAGAQVGSGGLYNNRIYESKPLLVADNPVSEWNTFRIIMVDDKVTVYLNGKQVTNNVILENYWDRKQPIFEKGPIELQAHASLVEYRDIFIREIPSPEPYIVSKEESEEGFESLFNGIDLSNWIGNKVDYFAQDGMIVCQPTGQKNVENLSGNLYTEKTYSDFILRFEFQLTPGANNGLGIRTPTKGDAAYVGMELQILDNDAEIYKNLKPYQYHGSVYGVIPAKRGFQKPVGEWNYQQVQAIGNRIKVTLNDEVILDGNIAEASKNGTQTADDRDHPGLLNESGHIGFLGHGSPLKFRNIRIKSLEE